MFEIFECVIEFKLIIYIENMHCMGTNDAKHEASSNDIITWK